MVPLFATVSVAVPALTPVRQVGLKYESPAVTSSKLPVAAWVPRSSSCPEMPPMAAHDADDDCAEELVGGSGSGELPHAARAARATGPGESFPRAIAPSTPPPPPR